jgi:hypothetical protein
MTQKPMERNPLRPSWVSAFYVFSAFFWTGADASCGGGLFKHGDTGGRRNKEEYGGCSFSKSGKEI